METTFTHQVSIEDEGKMLRQILQNKFRFSRRMLTRLKLNQLVTVNGCVQYMSARLKEGDMIKIRMPEDEVEHIPPQPIEFTVVYEDEDLIIIDKPPGLVVHPTRGYPDGTLANGLMHYWGQRGEKHRVRPVTRLDRDTSGLMVVGKHAYTHAFLAEQMATKRYERSYLAIVHGRVAKDQGTIDRAISINDEEKQYGTVVEEEEGFAAITHYEVVDRLSCATLLRLQLETGRTHQIRVHLSSIGHPIVGDFMYGSGNDEQWIARQALHSTYLRLFHPRHREWMEFSSPIPQDMKRCLEKLAQLPFSEEP